MRKVFVATLTLSFLYIVVAGSNMHNHPFASGENDHCPAYLISISYNFDQLPSALDSLTTLNTVIIYITLSDYEYQQAYYYSPINGRSPPPDSNEQLSVIG